MISLTVSLLVSISVSVQRNSTFRENTVKVEAFVRTADDCKMSCSDNYLCGYYKHFPSDDEKQPLVSCIVSPEFFLFSHNAAFLKSSIESRRLFNIYIVLVSEMKSAAD